LRASSSSSSLTHTRFTYVDALYPCNIPNSPSGFSHNPEWMLFHAKRFIRSAVDSRRRFFLYVAWTLPHTPFASAALYTCVQRRSYYGH